MIHRASTLFAFLALSCTAALWSGDARADVAVASPADCVTVTGPEQNWNNPTRAETSDNSYATSSVGDWDVTDYLRCTGYNFAIPADATIDGITVSVRRYASGDYVQDLAVRVVKNGVIGSADRSTSTVYPTGGAVWEEHGAAGDLWGDTWAAADINDPDFGAAFASKKATTSGGGRTVYVDEIRIYVEYTPAGSAAVINTYYPGSGTVAVGATTVTVGAATGSSRPIAVGDLVLIMQMQDAQLDYSNDDTYGDGGAGDPGSGTTNPGNSGLFEYAVAASEVPLTGGTLTLACGTVNSYANAGATLFRGKRTFQVIRVPVYDNYAMGSITASAWNGAVGGVLAFDVRGNLDLNSRNISVTGKGFRGGGGRRGTTGTGNYTDYRTPESNDANGSKGEGIAGTPYYLFTAPSTLTDTATEGYPSGSFARGAPGNAGGGATDRNPAANDQNPGGGGGGNGGSGGIGGIGWCPTFDGASAPYYGCGYAALASGVNPGGSTGGFGGAPVTGLGATRLTLGGGGGAATTNNATGSLGALSSSGAAGGGMIMIRAATLSGTATFNANGSDGDSTVRNDGSGGGGAGGAVLISAGSGMSGVTINTRGGTGGSNLVPPGSTSNPHGPGGGGGGGYAITSGVPGNCNAAGGDSGVTYATDSSGNAVLFGPYGALPGGSGGCSSGLVAGAIPGATLGGVPQCALGLHHFAIDFGSGDASTCVLRPIAISARDALNRVITDYTGTVALSTSTWNGTWFTSDGADPGADPAAGTLTDPTADDGRANYSFAAGDEGTVSLFLQDTHQETLTLTVRDTATGVTTSAGTLSFRDSALVVEPTTCTGATCATVPATGSTEVAAGRDHGFSITYLRRSGGACSASATYAGNIPLRLWITRSLDDPSGTAPTVGGVSLPGSVPADNNVTITFTAGVGNFLLSTTDVGKYAIGVLDSARNIDGASDLLTVRPFGITFSAIGSGATVNPGGTASSGSGFVSAGFPFFVTVGAYRWNAADDSDNNGLPDDGADLTNNGLTPAFAWDTPLTIASFTPTGTGAVAGALTGSPAVAVTQAAYAGGTGNNATLRYSEAGSIVLTATASDYLNSSGVNLGATSGNVGRFFPDHFVLSGAGLAHFCSGFSYMAQPLNLSYRVTAQNALNITTGNYDRARGYTHAPMPVPQFVAETDNGGDNAALSSRLSSAPSGAAPTWTAGEYSFGGTFQFTRDTTPDGPFDALQVGIRVVDGDGTVLTGRNMNAGTTGSCVDAANCDAVAMGGAASLRYGRARMADANGSELLDLRMPFVVQYFSSTGFVTNAGDTCTSGVTLARLDPDGSDGLADTEVCAWDNGAVTTIACAGTAPTVPDENFASPVASGSFNLWLKAPGNGNTGSMEIAANVPAWLRFDWDEAVATAETGPWGRAAFGIHKGSPRHIYLRELVQ